ncbi:uncharacterized protein LOC118420981 [Branchiostoma floridae]|uniref:Uncharacterized protein LOC118420981 n=1 Tax=Branchiostoma floridae TaxID=7739 RepID=A0A9J7LJE2_BRAFL|nr:uncharacterized protein LOC118420981 [Branchiostoma floridae]
MAAVGTRKAQSAGGPDGSAEVEPGRAAAGSEPRLGLKNLVKRLPIVRSFDVLSGGDRKDGKDKKKDVADGGMKTGAVQVESSEEPGVKALSADVGEFHDTHAFRSVASADNNLPTTEGGRLSPPTVPEPPTVSSKETLEGLRQQIEQLRTLCQTVNSQTAGFQRINAEIEEVNGILRKNFKKAEKVHKRTKQVMSKVKNQGYMDLLEAASQPQISPRRGRASADARVSSTEACASEVSLVVELRRAVSSLYDIQSADGISDMSENTDRSSLATALNSMSVDADTVFTLKDDLQYVWSDWALQKSKSVPCRNDDLQYVWFEEAPQNDSDTTSLDSFVTALSELADLDDQPEESTVQEKKKKNKLQRLRKWIQRKGRKIFNKIRGR